MNYSISILSDAEEDIDNAFIWYESKIIDLGQRFYVTIEESVCFISKNPFASREIYKGIRRYVIKQFPYGIYYKLNLEKEEVQIIGVVHFKRNTRIIKKRLDH